MTPERWQRINRIVEMALECHDDERTAMLDDECSGDSEMRREVESLLSYDAKATSFIERSPLAESDASVPVGDTTMLGRTLGNYTIEALLGAGGMGEVYLARDDRLRRNVALKVLTSYPGDEPLVRRFEQEARAASALNHPNILTIYDIGETDGIAFIVTEYIEGQTLRQRLVAGRVSVEDALAIAIQAAGALVAAHAVGIVHRDVKPENLMLRPDGYLKVLDFGLAKLLTSANPPDGDVSGDPTAMLTWFGAIVGTVPYMSPEQARGLAVGPQSDVWSLGIVLYETVTNHSPFLGPTASDTMAAILERELPAVEEYCPGVPRELSRILHTALAKAPSDRYATMAGFLDDLVRFKSGFGQTMLNTTLADATDRPEGRDTAAAWRRTSVIVPTNLPQAMTSFVGRSDELDLIGALLESTRALTLKGEGGIGKTRLALEVASAATRSNPDGVWLVELAALADPVLVPNAIAAVLGVREEGSPTLIAALCAYLRSKTTLLVLDNCEHLVDACAEVAAALLRACPGLRILATSREALGIGGEALWDVRPLSVPDLDRLDSLAVAGESESVRLFVERARLSKADFALTEANVSTVARLCRRLEGLALAVELAASKVRVLELDQILSRLDDRLSLLVGGGRGAPSRQRTMRAALDWSFDLLSASEAALVCRLSVFAGGWTLDAAEAVCGDDQPSAGAAGLVARGDVLEHLARFVDKSLVRVAPGARYSMLETIREYARERLRLSGHEPAALARHFDWSSALAQAAGIGPTGGMSLERLDAERDNLRVALRWAIGERNEPVGGLTMSAALGRFWSPSGLWAEGRTWLEAALAAAPDAPPALRSIAVRHLSGLVQEQGDYAYAKTLLEAALAEQRDRGDAAEVLNTMLVLARVVDRMGDQDRARAYWVEGLALARAGGNRRKIGAALTGFGVHLMERGDYVRADEWLAESLDLFREIDSPDNVAVALHNLGENAMRCGEIDKAARLLEESLTIARARHLPRVVAYSSQMLGIVALSLGDFDRARTTLLEALTIDWDDGDRDGIAYVFEGLARLASERRDARRAQCLAGAAAGLRRCTQSTLPPCQQADLDIALERARTALGPESSAVCFDEGLAMTLYEAIVFARA